MTEMQTARQTYTDLAPSEKVMFQAIMEMTIILLKSRQETQNTATSDPPLDTGQDT